MNSALFFDLLASITERGRNLLSRRSFPLERSQAAAGLIELCEALLSRRGEASGTALAAEILDRYLDLDEQGRLSLFEAFAERFGPDRERLRKAADQWLADP